MGKILRFYAKGGTGLKKHTTADGGGGDKYQLWLTMRMMLGGFPVDVFSDVGKGDNEDQDDDEKVAEEQKDSRGASLCSIMKFTGG